MRLSIQNRLALALVGLTAAVLVATLVLTRWSFVSGFHDYINTLETNRIERVASRLADLYADEGGWPDDIEFRFRRISHRPFPGHHQASGLPPPGLRRRSGPQPTALFDAEGTQLAGADLSDHPGEQLRATIRVDGRVIGMVRSVVRRRVSEPLADAFSERQLRTMLIIGGVALMLAIALAFLLARVLLTPVRRVLHGISQLSSGDYTVELASERADELGELMRDFDRLAVTLRESQHARRQLFADVSHELRTPLTILSAELEAVRDGVRDFDGDSLTSLEQEVERLRALVDDLFELAVSDVGALSYVFAPHALDELVHATVDALPRDQREGMSITLDLAPIEAVVDARRIEQLTRNLLVNALAYTDRPGTIAITLSAADDGIQLVVADSPPTVPAERCAQLFEPLFRMEESRSRRHAGAGLGLAICRKIVAAHQGCITATPATLGGLQITVTLPKRSR